MKFTIEQAKLLSALSHVQSIVERRNTIPILSNILLRAGQDGLSITATDLDMEIVERIPAQISTKGATTIPAHMSYEIIRRLGDDTTIALNRHDATGRLEISTEQSRFLIACLPEDDFPLLTSGETNCQFTLSASQLQWLIAKTRFAMAVEETRYYLTGLYLEYKEIAGEQFLRAVATDGHRLAWAQILAPQGAAQLPGIIIPRKTITAIERLADALGGDINITISPTKIRFSLEHASITSKLIDGAFPNYEQVIPKQNEKDMLIATKQISAAVDRVSSVSFEKMRAVKMAIDTDKLTLAANNPEIGSASEKMSIAYDGNNFEIGFNATYLLDILRQIDGEQTLFSFDESGSPTIIRESGNAACLYVLMPMRV